MEPNHPFKTVPSPWGVRGTSFFGCGWSRGLPPGSYGDLEAEADVATKYGTEADFAGGPCTIMVLRYTETPVGTYDEIIWIPGSFRLPGGKKKLLRSTRIYVSSLDTTYCGRNNWNIPKTLAHFTFTPAENPESYPPYTKIAIAPIDDPSTPFFDLDISPVPLLSRPMIPMNTAWIPMNLDLAMPPLPQSATWREDGMVGTEEWVRVGFQLSCKVGIVKVSGQIGNGKGFPKMDWMQGYWFWSNDMKGMIKAVDRWMLDK